MGREHGHVEQLRQRVRSGHRGDLQQLERDVQHPGAGPAVGERDGGQLRHHARAVVGPDGYKTSEWSQVSDRPSLTICYTCQPGFADCDGNAANGCENNLNTTPSNCGSCGHACSFAHATALCTAGACALGACDAGWGNCDGDASNGCETNLNTTTSSCGTCGNACAALPHAAAACSGAACVLGACDAGWGNCDGASANGCETSTETMANCGTCGNACVFANATALCTAGACALGACNAGTFNCDGNPANGCEPTPCADGSHCVNSEGCQSSASSAATALCRAAPTTSATEPRRGSTAAGAARRAASRAARSVTGSTTTATAWPTTATPAAGHLRTGLAGACGSGNMKCVTDARLLDAAGARGLHRAAHGPHHVNLERLGDPGGHDHGRGRRQSSGDHGGGRRCDGQRDGHALQRERPLHEGNNILLAKATNAGGASGSDSAVVLRDTSPPRAVILTPADGAFINSGQSR